MAETDGSHGQDGDKVRNVPTIRDKVCGCKDDHGDDSEQRQRERVLEAFQDFWDFDPEVGVFGLHGVISQ